MVRLGYPWIWTSLTGLLNFTINLINWKWKQHSWKITSGKPSKNNLFTNTKRNVLQYVPLVLQPDLNLMLIFLYVNLCRLFLKNKNNIK